MDFLAGSIQSLAQTGWQRLRIPPAFLPLFFLVDQISVDLDLVSQIVSDGTVNFFQGKQRKILADGFGRLATAEPMNDRIERDSRPCDIRIAAAIFDVFLRHSLYYLPSTASIAFDTSAGDFVPSILWMVASG